MSLREKPWENLKKSPHGTVPLGLHLAPEMMEKLSNLAKADRRTRGDYVFLLVEKHIEEKYAEIEASLKKRETKE